MMACLTIVPPNCEVRVKRWDSAEVSAMCPLRARTMEVWLSNQQFRMNWLCGSPDHDVLVDEIRVWGAHA